MQRIYKKIAEGNLIIDNVLNSAWSQLENRYEGNIYYGLLDAQNRSNIIRLFLMEQNGKCCYCMQTLTIAQVTIEHIIPQNANEIEYLEYLTVPELSGTLIHKNLFDREHHIIPPQLYPHDFAYNNLIASCNSKIHCNNKRGKTFIQPFLYYDNLERICSYEPFGSCYFDGSLIDIDPLNLNNDFLKMVRKLWFLIARREATIAHITTAGELQLVVDEIISNEEDKFIETFTGPSSRVPDLIKYSWFFDYFKSR